MIYKIRRLNLTFIKIPLPIYIYLFIFDLQNKPNTSQIQNKSNIHVLFYSVYSK